MQGTVLLAKNGSEISDLARRAVKEGVAVVVAAGGDGTLNAVASVLVGGTTILAVLPLGTLNHFAKDIGIPLELEAAVETVVTGVIVRVDVGKVNSQHFLNNSSLGLYPAIVQQREEVQHRGHGKWLSFAVAAWHALRRYKRLYVTCQTEGHATTEEETPFVFVGNNRYKISGLSLGKRDRLDAGELWVYRAPKASRMALFRLFVRAMSGRPDPDELITLPAQKFQVRTRKEWVQVATDGEVQRMQSPLDYSIMPQALNVIVPRQISTNEPSQSDSCVR